MRNIEVHYEPVVGHFSTAKILLVCCVETYVNEVAATILNGRVLDEFDQLSIMGKWIFIQELLKTKKKLTIDRGPLQGLSRLIKNRNKLVHFKGLKKDLHLLEVPDYLTDLQLDPNSLHRDLEMVKNLIRDFSIQWKGSFGPGWLNIGSTEFRNPCFYLGNRHVASVLYSNKYDRDLHKDEKRIEISVIDLIKKSKHRRSQ